MSFFVEKLQKINCKTFHRKTYLTWFCESVSNLLSKVVQGKRFLLLTRFRPLDLKFSKDSSIWKSPFTHQINFQAIQLQKLSKFDIFQKIIFCTLASSINFRLNAVSVAKGQYLWRYFTFVYWNYYYYYYNYYCCIYL